MASFFPSDETSWTLLALLLLYFMLTGGANFPLPVWGAIAFVGLMVIGTAQQHH
ncbi:MAG TPA: hypothetical protein VJI13_00120 [Candidatus Norongarragalinales archaeon]|nr:hypothetical protein [Candidatus Norongarragalinales archaeon]